MCSVFARQVLPGLWLKLEGRVWMLHKIYMVCRYIGQNLTAIRDLNFSY